MQDKKDKGNILYIKAIEIRDT
ncbi:hypothetical protein FOXYSP1_08421 [Fusarium oxysporum f. sp. phaseoli]